MFYWIIWYSFVLWVESSDELDYSVLCLCVSTLYACRCMRGLESLHQTPAEYCTPTTMTALVDWTLTVAR